MEELSKAQEEIKGVIGAIQAHLDLGELTEVSRDINNRISEKSYIRNFCDTTVPEIKNTYLLEYGMLEPAWVLPGLGYVAQDFMDPDAEEIRAMELQVQAAKDWSRRYDEDERYDVWDYAMKAIADAISSYEIEAFFRLLIPVCTSNVPNAPKPLRWAPIAQPNPPAKYCSVELIHRMAKVMLERGEILETVLIGPEDLNDIREYVDENAQLPPDGETVGNLSFFLDKNEFNVKVKVTRSLGLKGKYTIFGAESEFGPFTGNSKENRFNDYVITNPTVLDQNAEIVKKGETQIYGFGKSSKEYFKLPITYPYKAFWDPSLVRRGKSGFYGWQKMCMLTFSSRCVVMGIIDRSE